MAADVLFFVFAGFAIACAVSMVYHKNPLYSAISLVGVFIALACLYVTLAAPFIAIVQILIYAGAIMVLVVFVIMLLNAGSEARRGKATFAKWIGIPVFTAFIFLIAFMIQARLPQTAGVTFGTFTKAGGADIGRVLFTQYLLPFEVTSILILIAILGAVVLARKEI